MTMKDEKLIGLEKVTEILNDWGYKACARTVRNWSIRGKFPKPIVALYTHQWVYNEIMQWHENMITKREIDGD